MRAHVMWPDYLLGVTSDRGREGVPVKDTDVFRPLPLPLPVFYRFDVSGFIRALKEKLKGNVAGYSIRLNENGSTIGLADGAWRRSRRTAARTGRWIPG